MSPSIRWICLAACLLMLLGGCVEDNPNIRPASEATAGGEEEGPATSPSPGAS